MESPEVEADVPMNFSQQEHPIPVVEKPLKSSKPKYY